MASLASKLFQVSPNRASWFTSFRGSLPTFLASQTLTLNPPPLDFTPTSPKEIISLFTSLQTQLFESVAELQDAKKKIAREIKAKDAVILAFANKLKEAVRVLDLLVDDYSDYHPPERSKMEESVTQHLHHLDLGRGKLHFVVLFLRPHKKNKCVLRNCIISLILILNYLR